MEWNCPTTTTWKVVNDHTLGGGGGIPQVFHSPQGNTSPVPSKTPLTFHFQLVDQTLFQQRVLVHLADTSELQAANILLCC